MMSKKSPQLRFEGFTDDWEERKFGELYKKMNEKNDLSFGKDRVISVANMYFKDTGNIRSDDAYMKTYNIFRTGDIAFEGNRSKHFAYGRFVENTIGDGIVSHVFDVFRPIQQFDLNYWKYAIHNERVMGPILMTATTSSTMMTNLVAKDFLKRAILVPSYSEQKLVGSFFKQLDDTIALHQRKLDLLKEQKKGYLQKMFPKNGAKVPELRFAGFADDWEERKLSDVANHRGGTAIEKYFDKDGVYKVISIGSYGLNSQYVDQNIRAISNEITDGRVVNSGELTMVLNDKTANGTIIGRTLLVEKDNEYVINQRTEIISPKENFDSNFAYTILNGPFREKVKRIVQGGTQIYVNYPAVSNLNLELPKIEEQQKIGSFFKQLDDTIALHQHKLDLLKEQKKGFLQKMFV